MAYLQSKWKLKPVNLVPDYKDHNLGEGGQTSNTRYCLVAPIEGQPDTYRMMSTPFKCQYYLGDHIWASEEKVKVTIHGYPADGIDNPVPEIIRLMVMRAHPATPLLCQLVNKALRRKLITNVYKLAADVEHVCKGSKQIAQADNTLVIEFAKEVRTCVPFLNFITWMCRQNLTEATTLWEMFHTMEVPGKGDLVVRSTVTSEKVLHTILREAVKFPTDTSVYMLDTLAISSFQQTYPMYNRRKLAPSMTHMIHNSLGFAHLVGGTFIPNVMPRPTNGLLSGPINNIRRKLRYVIPDAHLLQLRGHFRLAPPVSPKPLTVPVPPKPQQLHMGVQLDGDNFAIKA